MIVNTKCSSVKYDYKINYIQQNLEILLKCIPSSITQYTISSQDPSPEMPILKNIKCETLGNSVSRFLLIHELREGRVFLPNLNKIEELATLTLLIEIQYMYQTYY